MSIREKVSVTAEHLKLNPGYIGKSVKRIDAYDKATGKGKFVEDYRKRI